MANPILVDAMKYYDERADMNNPKAWDHVLRQYEHALSVPDSPWADVDEATKAEALTVLRALVDLETTTETVWHHAGSSRNRWKAEAETLRAENERLRAEVWRLTPKPPVCPKCEARVAYSSEHLFGGANPGWRCPPRKKD